MTTADEAGIGTAEAQMDPEMAAIARRLPKLEGFDLEAMRHHARMSKAEWNEAPLPPGVSVEETRIEGAGGSLEHHVFTPAGATGAPILHLHGGGWAVGNLRSTRALFAGLAQATGRRVEAPHVRQAPEHPHPAPLEDALAAIRAVAQAHGGPVVLAGDSAGAHLALAACLAARDAGTPLPVSALVLYYGCFRRLTDTPSHRRFGSGAFGLSSEKMALFWSMLMPPGTPAPGPDLAAAKMHDLPPVQIQAAGLDPLLDDSLWLHEALANSGAPVELHVWPGVLHGFLGYHADLAAARGALAATAGFLAARSAGA